MKVIDADRFLLATGEEIECLGIYIPVFEHRLKEEVISEIQKLVIQKPLTLEFDSTKPALSGKLRAYIFVDGIFVNAEMVKRGYAFLLPNPEKLKYGSILIGLEGQAKAEKRGLWDERVWTESCDCH